MPRIKFSQLGQPQEGNIQLIVVRPLDGSPALYLEIPIAHLASLCIRPRKYLRYLGWCIMGVEGRVARDSPQPVNDIKDEGELESGSVYSYQIPEGSDQLLEHAVNMDAFNARSTSSGNSLPSQVAQDLQLFRRSLEERDVCCIMTAFPEYTASHIIPYAHENAWIDVIIHNRSNNNENVDNLTVNDVRNGILVASSIHSLLESRRVAFLKTPNPVLNTDDIPTINDRLFTAGTACPDGERFTLQFIEVMEDLGRSVVAHSYRVGRDAAFSIDTDTVKPSGVLLHYNYGSAAVKWWGHHTDILRSPGPPHPPPPPSESASASASSSRAIISF
ncbi:hypothetical protein BGY98DRAFT_1092842 [Russula aff. rugulosa BPL654]|nr:hypothetical protein BGY98DRAFT_1092842 [Russula aff. rugulosa BPL654]